MSKFKIEKENNNIFGNRFIVYEWLCDRWEPQNTSFMNNGSKNISGAFSHLLMYKSHYLKNEDVYISIGKPKEDSVEKLQNQLDYQVKSYEHEKETQIFHKESDYHHKKRLESHIENNQKLIEEKGKQIEKLIEYKEKYLKLMTLDGIDDLLIKTKE